MTAKMDGPNVPVVSREIPYPDVPIHPVLSERGLLGNGNHQVPSIEDVGNAEYVSAGRIAIVLALQRLGLAQGDEVLLPAYHCLSMVEPLSFVGAKAVYYRVEENFAVDLADVSRKISPRTRCLLAVNYFGFPQDLPRLRAFCDEHELFFIEDCAHSFFGAVGGKPLGSFGDFAIGSLTKFFPVVEGGCLVSARFGGQRPQLKRQGIYRNLKDLFQVIENANYYGRLRPLRWPMRGLQHLRTIAVGANNGTEENEAVPADQLNPAQQGSGAESTIDRSWLERKATATTTIITSLAPRKRIAARRRSNYRRLVEGLSDIPNSRPVLPDLPDGVVPFMVPFWVDDLPEVFQALEDAAVPMQRFGQFLSPEIDENLCAWSTDFSNFLVQFPCHEELWDNEVDWIIATVRKILTRQRK